MAIRRVNQDGLWERKCRECKDFFPELSGFHLFSKGKRQGTPSSNLCRECHRDGSQHVSTRMVNRVMSALLRDHNTVARITKYLGVSPTSSLRSLRVLVEEGKVVKRPFGNQTWYEVLVPSSENEQQMIAQKLGERVSDARRREIEKHRKAVYEAVMHGHNTQHAIQDILEMPHATVNYTVRVLCEDGVLLREKEKRGRKYIYKVRDEESGKQYEREEEMADPRLRIMSDPEGLIREIVAKEVASRDELVAGLEKQIHDLKDDVKTIGRLMAEDCGKQIDNLFTDGKETVERVKAIEERLSSHGKTLARMNGADTSGRDAKIAELEKDVAVVRNLRQLLAGGE